MMTMALLAACSRTESVDVTATLMRSGLLDRERLLAVADEPGSWLTTGRDFGETYYSPLTAINESNVSRLGFAWQLETGTGRGMEATPLVMDGVMIVSGVAGRVYAMNAATGAMLWQFEPQVNGKAFRGACCDMVNRGVAVWQGKVYVAALDGILYALNANNGNVLWQADTIDDKQRAYSITGAPQVAGNVVVIGNGGAEFDARGYVTAYDLETGKQAWRFYTVPGDPKKGFEHPELEEAAKTWDPESRWEFGMGGTPWDALAYDPELNLLYVGTGNAAPWNRKLRSPKGGDNLYLSSILAINPDTGRLVWHYQEVPQEMWDYTATQPFILASLNIDGADRKVIMHAPKNGFFYVLDRATGQLLSAEKYEDVTWATHVDLKTGRPVFDPGADYTDGKPKLVFPAPVGAHNFNPMSLSAKTGLVYIPTVHLGALFAMPEKPGEWLPGRGNTNVQTAFSMQLAAPETLPPALRPLADPKYLATMPDPTPSAALKAWDPITHKVVWSFKYDQGFMDHGGVLSTAGGLVFQGSLDGTLRIFRDTDGQLLKEIEVGTAMIAAPMTYTVDDVQYVAILAGSGGGGWNTWMPGNIAARKGNANRIIAFKLDGGSTPVPSDIPPPGPLPQPPAQPGSAADIAAGAALYGANCGGCHQNAFPGPVPDLRRSAVVADANAFRDVLLNGALEPRGMSRWDDLLSAQQVDQLRAYLISVAQQAYAAQQN
ncbi:MAG: PQQ-dependent dehydrogenase, methanol/ethanol family [Nevskiaceae bacterium]|nr:PQQ-dependent dehydrogenase, methanol/ethanol family [Nevskiaceae bacterium]